MKIGLELEGHLIDKNGTLSNKSPEVIEDPRNNGDILPELSKTMWEVIAPPESNLGNLRNSFKERLIMLNEIANDYGLRAVPVSSLHNESKVESRDYERPRGMRKRIVLKNEKRDLEHHLTGTHVHVDRIDGDERAYNQFLLMQAMDPAFSLMSSSPFFHGKNSLKDYRVEIYRNKVFEDFPKQGQLLDYPVSLESAFERQKECYNDFTKILKENELDADGLNELNCIWGPLRLTGFGTIESRAADSNKLSNVIALAALYQGISRYTDGENLQAVIDDGEYDISQMFIPKNGKVIIPNYKQLKNFEKIGVEEGLSNHSLNKYLSNMVDTCSKGLEDKTYLEPFKQMIKEERNFSDEIVDYAKSTGLEKQDRIKGSGAKILRNYIADSYEKDLLN
jgi:gamma-glutamyl:cysteine ligase YbdK (ATP-grasp superfamily)